MCVNKLGTSGGFMAPCSTSVDTQLLFFLTEEAADGGFDIPTTLFLPLMDIALVLLPLVLALVALILLLAVDALELAAELWVYCDAASSPSSENPAKR